MDEKLTQERQEQGVFRLFYLAGGGIHQVILTDDQNYLFNHLLLQMLQESSDQKQIKVLKPPIAYYEEKERNKWVKN